MRRATAVAAALLGLSIGAIPALAQDSEYTIVIDGVTEGAEGDVVQVAERLVDEADVGASCMVSSRTENNSSVHPGTDVIITTGGSDTVIEGIEDEPGQVVSVSSPVVLGDAIAVFIRLGPDGRSSGGVTITFDCEEVEVIGTTTTTAAPTTTTAAPQHTWSRIRSAGIFSTAILTAAM